MGAILWLIRELDINPIKSPMISYPLNPMKNAKFPVCSAFTCSNSSSVCAASTAALSFEKRCSSTSKATGDLGGPWNLRKAVANHRILYKKCEFLGFVSKNLENYAFLNKTWKNHGIYLEQIEQPWIF